ncbi:hypothetical protein GGR51DRAFT_566058 [Nemania sp. FL0031]|nr:hypothetical protein GGR51DRAFT_566058 [Nemania sp. FL0031]
MANFSTPPSSEDLLVGTSLQHLAYEHWKPLSRIFYPGDCVCWKPKSTCDAFTDDTDNAAKPVAPVVPCFGYITTRGDGFRGALIYLYKVFWKVSFVRSVIFLISNAWNWHGIGTAIVPFLASLLRINMLLAVLVVLCQLPLLTIDSPGCPRGCGSCVCYAAYYYSFAPKFFRVINFYANTRRYNELTGRWRDQCYKPKTFDPQQYSEQNRYARHKLYMQLFQQNWYVARLAPPTDTFPWVPSCLRWVVRCVAGDGLSCDSFRWLIACGLVFYGNFQRRLPQEPAPAELLASEQGNTEWSWYTMPSPDNIRRFLPLLYPDCTERIFDPPTFKEFICMKLEMLRAGLGL